MHGKKELDYFDLGVMGYEEAWKIQKTLQDLRKEGAIKDTLLFLEHPPVYTKGRRASEKDILFSEEKLQEEGIQVFEVDRGGLITYHGPGQLVGYLIFHLKENHRASLSWFVWALEEVSIQALQHWEIAGKRIPGLTGVWVGNKKITAIGVRMSRWVTMHGFAFNLAPNLDHFKGIVPCGIPDRGVTSLAALIPSCPSMSEVKEVFLKKICHIFAFEKVERKSKESLCISRS
ncbi:MAG: lipoyl(octanoyl) transferase LipB [Planctomycetota bacterium]|nr:MAG: lipoyl(octanoyl) transferase LipB [Planctomycetota bacterium]